MIPVADARRIVVSRLQPMPAEMVPLQAVADRVLAADARARVTHPAVAVSSMDGYAVRAADLVSPPVALRLAGVAAAGAGFTGVVASGEAVRIFTGAPLPEGADSIVIQERVHLDGDRVVVREGAPPDLSMPGRWIRPAGMDFTAGDTVLRAGRRLTPRDVMVAAAANITALAVRQQPKVAFLANGDELVPPGEQPTPAQTINSNGVFLALQLRQWGAIPVDLGIVADDVAALARTLAAAAANLIITVGGASVGDRDLVHAALASLGFERGFSRVAMRPGKPTAFGWLNGTPVLVLPGNPVSAAVTAYRFARPIIESLLAISDDALVEGVSREGVARLHGELPANDEREDYIRGTLRCAEGALQVTPLGRQDSALTALLAAADCLIVRPPRVIAAKSGDVVPFIRL